MRRLLVPFLATVVAATALAACSSGGAADRTRHPRHPRLVRGVEARARGRSRGQTGWKVRVLKNGDAGAALNQVILTKDAPLGDAFYGVDNTFLTRALDAKVFDRVPPAGARRASPPDLRLDPTGHATPVDFGDVCINVDKQVLHARRRSRRPRRSTTSPMPDFKDQLVVENPATSSTGLAFVAATVAKYGDRLARLLGPAPGQRRARRRRVGAGVQRRVLGRGREQGHPTARRQLRVEPAGRGVLRRPAAGDRADRVPPATCFRQVEFVGVLHGAAHPAAARKLVDFMLTKRFQADMPLQMFVYPAVTGTPLPPVFTKFSSVPADPLTLSPGADRP